MNTKQRIYYELRSFLMTFLAAFLVDASTQINTILGGDFSKAAWLALTIAAAKVLLKVLSTILIPSVPTSLNSNIVHKSI